MPFAATGSLRDLGSFIFGDHSLKLYQQPILRTVAASGFEENRFHSAAVKLLEQQHLIGVFSAEPIRAIDQDCLQHPLTCQIAKTLQPRTIQDAPAVALILENPVFGYDVVRGCPKSERIWVEA